MLSHMTYVNQSEATLENYSGTVDIGGMTAYAIDVTT